VVLLRLWSYTTGRSGSDERSLGLAYERAREEHGLLARHNGTWRDSLALTHCLCWGAAWRMLDYLLANPEEFNRLLAALHSDREVER
jgi:hypothetical protein